MTLWPWRRGVEDAQKRLAEATEKTSGTDDLAQYSREVNNELLGVIALNGFGKAIQVAMARPQGPKGQQA